MNLQYENILASEDYSLFAIGSNFSFNEKDEELVNNAVGRASKKDLALILTHDDPFLIDKATNGLLFKRVKDEFEYAEIARYLLEISRWKLCCDAFLSNMGSVIFIFDGEDAARIWETKVRSKVPESSYFGFPNDYDFREDTDYNIWLKKWLHSESIDNATFARKVLLKLKKSIDEWGNCVQQ